MKEGLVQRIPLSLAQRVAEIRPGSRLEKDCDYLTEYRGHGSGTACQVSRFLWVQRDSS